MGSAPGKTIRHWVHGALLRLRALARRRQLDHDLQDELRFHLAMRAAQESRDGQPAGEAGFAATRRFGNPRVIEEECRDMWTFRLLETLAQDVRYAVRVLLRSPGFTAVAVLSLALGIGGNAAMWSVLRSILLRPLPYPQAERLVRLTGSYPKGAVVALQERSRTMEVAGVGSPVEVNLTGGGAPSRVFASSVSANLFTVLGGGAALGRVFEAGDDRPGRDRIAVLGHALWEERFGADPSVIGRMVAMDGVERQIVGVMPGSFHFPSGVAQIWIPLRLDPGLTEDYWGFGWMPAVGRLREGATLAQAHAELRALVPEVAKLFPWAAPTWNADAAALRLQDDLVRDLRPRLLLLQSSVAMVLLIACANVASLLLSRAAARRKEISLRAALGAGRGRVLRQLLTESLVLSLAGGALGVGLAMAVLQGLRRFVLAYGLGFSEVTIDGYLLAFVTALSVGCGLLFGLVPAAVASRVDLGAFMKAGGPRATSPAGSRLRSSFIALEVALAVVLAVGAGLFLRTLFRLSGVDPGFRSERTLSVRVAPDPAAACTTRSGCVALYDELLRRVAATDGVTEVAAANALPLFGDQPLLPVELEGHALVDGTAPLLWAGAVTPRYLEVMGVPLLRGRTLAESDGERSEGVLLVSAATARRYWPDQDPIGKKIRVVWDQEWRTIVGVVGDVRQYALSGRGPAEITGALYMPYPQSVALDRKIPRPLALLVRSTAEPAAVSARLRELVSLAFPDMPVGEVRSLDDLRASSVEEPRSLSRLFAAFAGIALLLAAIGTYGVVSYTTAQRHYEIGVRVALGATRRDILGMVIGQSLRLVVAGLAIGAVAALLLGRALRGLLYGVSPSDPVTFVAVAVVLIATACLAGYLPGRRAAATDPVRALRAD